MDKLEGVVSPVIQSDKSARRIGEVVLAQLSALAGAAESAARPQLGHLLFLLTDALQTLDAPTTARPNDLSDHLRHRSLAFPTISELTAQIVGPDSPESLGGQARRLLSELRRVVESEPLPQCVESLFGPARLADYLRGHLIDAVVLGRPMGVDPAGDALAESVRALTTTLGQRFGGRTIEIRIPPYAAVQVGAFGEGPSHTRGTPPNVIETDATTFIDLAVGRLVWQDISRTGAVNVSGAHTDQVSAMFPLLTLPR